MAQKSDRVLSSIMHAPQYNVVFRDPESILKKQLGDDVSVDNFKSESFLKYGDNYGSTVKKITVFFSRKTKDKIEKLELIGKLLPPTDIQRVNVKIDHTFQREVFFYEEIIPMLQNIYKKEFNFAPQYYGSRESLKPGTDEIIDDAVILLENLQPKGYYVVSRQKGLDLEHLSAVIPVIAKFHAIGLSIKHKNPSFLRVLKKSRHLSNFSKKIIEKVLQDMDQHPDVNQYHARIKALYDNPKILDSFYKKPLDLEDPWTGIAHMDMFNSNLLFHSDENGKIDDVKVIDFQAYAVNSPLRDLIFLLGSSMQYPMEHFDRMIELYRQSIRETSKELNLDVYLFEKQQFEEKLKIDAISEIFHLIVGIVAMEYREGEFIEVEPASEFTIRRLRRVCEIYEQKKWFQYQLH